MKHLRTGKVVLILLACTILPKVFIEGASVTRKLVVPSRVAEKSFANDATFPSQQGDEPTQRPRRSFLRRLLAMLGCFAWWATSSDVKGYDAACAVQAAAMSNDQTLQSLQSIDAIAASLAVESARRSKAKRSSPTVDRTEPASPPKSAPVPHVPGLDTANLVIQVSTEPGRANEVMAKRTSMTASELMAESPETILRMISRPGWRVELPDPETVGGGRSPDSDFEIFLNPVKYELPLGVITIPAPHFRAHVRETEQTQTEGPYKERLETDLVLQNGDGIVTVSLNFPFSTSFSIGAAGWLRASIGQYEDDVRVRADVEIGLNVPRIPGLGSALECFVKHYIQRSTFGCATSFRTQS
ncbi:Uncharacterized protein SCF082_LOCUS11998 [Durusdinium trenchii]|uniref:Uncharacterized protein n=1 Tax=Durusdinium trenchii TaxID=1381693 RepID=A0ABP0JGR6_9DINO